MVKKIIGKPFEKGYKPWNLGMVGVYSVNKGNKHPRWKGGIRKSSKGYVYIYYPEHPFADSSKAVLEHRLVMEDNLGRYLTKKEIVHHVNGKRDDNRIENLILLNKTELGSHSIFGKGVEVECPKCKHHFVCKHS